MQCVCTVVGTLAQSKRWGNEDILTKESRSADGLWCKYTETFPLEKNEDTKPIPSGRSAMNPKYGTRFLWQPFRRRYRIIVSQ